MDSVGPSRHRLFSAALARADWSRDQLWMGYLSLGGVHDSFDLDAYLSGLLPWSADQQDVLAVAVNERLHDLYVADCVPLQLVEPPRPTPTQSDALQVLLEFVRDRSR